MAEPCASEAARIKDASEDFGEAAEALKDAQDAYDDAGDFLDDNTFWDVAGVAAVAGACLSNPFSWLVCGAGIIAGGATVTASELGRADEIAAAEKALERAQQTYSKALGGVVDGLNDLHECLEHELTKQSP